MKRFYEIKMSRIVSKNDDFCMISAFKGYYSLKENLIRNYKLGKDLLKEGLGFVNVFGAYVEKKDRIIMEDDDLERFINSLTEVKIKKIEEEMKKYNANELSYFVYYNSSFGSRENFLDYIVELGKKYEQESILYYCKKEDKAYLIYLKDMIVEYIGNNIDVNEMIEFFSVLRYGKHKGKTFRITHKEKE